MDDDGRVGLNRLVFACARISRATVAYHLGVLRDADFVETRIDENRRLYRLRWNALDALDREMLDLYKIWDRRYGWPYRNDPMAEPARRHRLTERAAQWAPVTQAEVEPRAPDDAETRPWPEADEDDF